MTKSQGLQGFVLPIILVICSAVTLLASASILLAQVDASVNESFYADASIENIRAHNCTVIFMHKIQNHINVKGLDFQVEFGPNYLIAINESSTVCEVKVTNVQMNPSSESWQIGFQVILTVSEYSVNSSGWIDVGLDGRLRIVSLSSPMVAFEN